MKVICDEIMNCDNLPTNMWLLKARHVEMPDKVFVERYWPGHDCERAEYRKVCKKRGKDEEGNLIAERRRYVPEGGTESEWKARCRDAISRENGLRKERDAAITAQLEAQGSEASMRAERDGLLWAIEERDALIRDMAAELRYLNDGGISTDCMEHEARMRDMGIEVRR